MCLHSSMWYIEFALLMKYSTSRPNDVVGHIIYTHRKCVSTVPDVINCSRILSMESNDVLRVLNISSTHLR